VYLEDLLQIHPEEPLGWSHMQANVGVGAMMAVSVWCHLFLGTVGCG
jgi:hypothetical protein